MENNEKEKLSGKDKKTVFTLSIVIVCVILFVVLVCIAFYQSMPEPIKVLDPPPELKPILVSADIENDYGFEHPIYKGEKVNIINPVYRGEPFEIKLLND